MPDPINGAETGGGIPSPAPSPAPAPAPAPYTPPPQPQYTAPSNTQFGSAPTPGSYPQQYPQQQPPPYTPQPSYAPQQASPLRDSLTARGFDTSAFGTEDELISAFSDALPVISNLPSIINNARYGAQYREHEAEFGQWLAERQQREPAPQAPPEPPKSKWDAPPFDPKWASHVRYDQDSGTYVAKDMLSSPIAVEGMNRRAEFLREKQQKFWDNPYEFSWEGIQDKVEQLVAERQQAFMEEMQTRQQEAEVVGETEQWLYQNLHHLYQTDPQGTPLLDPRTGEAALTPLGRIFQHNANQVRQMGVQNPIYVRDLALSMTRDYIAAQQVEQQPQAPAGYAPAQDVPAGAATPPRGPDGKFLPAGAAQSPQQPAYPMTAAGVSQQRIDQYTQRAYRQPNYGGSENYAAANGAPQNPNMSFGEMAIAELRNRGAVPHTG